MKTIHTYNIIIILTLMFVSCGKSFLDAPPTDIFPREEAIQDLEDCERLLRGTYRGFALAYGTFTDLYMELVTDNVKPAAAVTNLRSFYTWNQQADDNPVFALDIYRAVNLNSFSFQYYNLVRTSSFIIERTTEFKNTDPGKADYIIGSALTLRAYAYYILVNIFAQPYNYTPQGTHPGIVYSAESNWTNTEPKRATVSFVYEKIIEDLEKAIPLFHDEATTTIKYNGNFPIALLSRIMLCKGDYASSLKYSKQCMQKYPLLTIENGYPDNIFKKTTTRESEVMFHLLPRSSASMGYAGDASFSNLYYQYAPDFVPTSTITQLLTENPKDVRAKWVTNDAAGWKVSKFPSNVIPDVDLPELSYFQPLARVSEMYLNAAESAYHLQQENEARTYLTQLIQRADPATPAVSASGQNLLDLIRKERRKELAFEGLRLVDLQRWKLPIVRPDDPQFPQLNLPSDKAIAPLPKQDIQTPGVPQNPGY